MIAIAVSEFNTDVCAGLLAGCWAALLESGISEHDIDVTRIPGAFELPAAAARLSEQPGVQAVITLGAVIRGETDHYHYISEAVTRGLMQVTLRSPVPVLFGVLTCQNVELARARSEPTGRRNKGYEVGMAAVSMIAR
jgi:6,7-dimethyl-8-ribityllumazine synthase